VVATTVAAVIVVDTGLTNIPFFFFFILILFFFFQFNLDSCRGSLTMVIAVVSAGSDG